MKKNRSELRNDIVIILYQVGIFKKYKIDYNLEDLIKDLNEVENDFVNEVVYGVITNQLEIDNIANKHLKGWTIDRLGLPDQAILRMSIYELLYLNTPEIVVINEAIELAKLYSDDSVRKMINATLDSIYQKK